MTPATAERRRPKSRSAISLASTLASHLRTIWFGRTQLSAPLGNELGRRGESHAVRHLRSLGFRVLARNVRTRTGEADLVCRDPDGETMVIVEVKTRRLIDGKTAHGLEVAPERSITAHKKRKLQSVLRSLKNANDWGNRPVRVDVIAIELDDTGPRERWTIRHHSDILR